MVVFEGVDFLAAFLAGVFLAGAFWAAVFLAAFLAAFFTVLATVLTVFLAAVFLVAFFIFGFRFQNDEGSMAYDWKRALRVRFIDTFGDCNSRAARKSHGRVKLRFGEFQVQ